MNADQTFREIDGPTPAGGVKSIIFFSKDGKPCPESEATNCEIHELNKDGEVIHRTYGEMN